MTEHEVWCPSCNGLEVTCDDCDGTGYVLVVEAEPVVCEPVVCEPVVPEMIRVLLGCEWGHGVSTPDDAERCSEPAERIVCLHNPHGVPDQPDGICLKLCARHLARVEQETTPTAERDALQGDRDWTEGARK